MHVIKFWLCFYFPEGVLGILVSQSWRRWCSDVDWMQTDDLGLYGTVAHPHPTRLPVGEETMNWQHNSREGHSYWKMWVMIRMVSSNFNYWSQKVPHVHYEVWKVLFGCSVINPNPIKLWPVYNHFFTLHFRTHTELLRSAHSGNIIYLRMHTLMLMMLFFYVQAEKQTVQEQNKPEFLKVALRKTPVVQSSWWHNLNCFSSPP